jgi:hypothetical protein
MGWPFPTENQDPFFEAFQAMMTALDSSGYAAREDRNLIFGGGGTMTWNINPLNGIGTLTWSSTLFVFSSNVGFYHAIAAGSIQLQTAELVYCILTRAPTANITTTLASSPQFPPAADGDAWYCLGVMGGDNRLYFRNGKVMNDGDSAEVLQTNGGGFGKKDEILNLNIPIALREDTDLSSYQVVGQYWFDPADYVISGTTPTLVLKTIAFTTLPSDLGYVALYDLTNAAWLAECTFSSSTPTQYTDNVVTWPTGPALLEIRIMCEGDATGDKTYCQWAGLNIQLKVD